jgi:hypothetical protein
MVNVTVLTSSVGVGGGMDVGCREGVDARTVAVLAVGVAGANRVGVAVVNDRRGRVAGVEGIDPADFGIGGDAPPAITRPISTSNAPPHLLFQRTALSPAPMATAGLTPPSISAPATSRRRRLCSDRILACF